MHMLGERVRVSIAGVLLLAFGGCSSVPSPADIVDKPSPGSYIELAAHNKLLDHPSVAVAAPAGLGLGLGTLVGIPIMIVALPITLGFGIAAWTDSPKADNLKILGNAVAWPDAVVAVGGCYMFGGIPYLIVGDSSSASRKAATRVMPPPAPDAVRPDVRPEEPPIPPSLLPGPGGD
jgi:hypothetical protein